MASIKTWRKKFREYVKSHDGVSLQDLDGNDIDFDEGKPMWAEGDVISEFGDFVNVEVRADGILDSVVEDVIANWLRGFAAYMGVYHADINITRDEDSECEKDYSITAAMEIPKEPFSPAGASHDSEEFWIVGDETTATYMCEEGRGYDGYVLETTSDPMCAMRFPSKKDAINWLCTVDDAIDWAGGTPYPSRVMPLKVKVGISISGKE